MIQYHTVIAILEAKSGKENLLKEELICVAKFSKAEKTCIEYRLHQDNANPSLFILYEIWESKLAHEAQFTKSYIREFIKNIDGVLVKPYQVYLTKELSDLCANQLAKVPS